MKTAKDLCLSIAVAGMVAGAGSALGCAVASADPGDAAGGRSEGTAASDSAVSAAPTSRGARPGAGNGEAGAQDRSSAADRIATRPKRVGPPAGVAAAVPAPVGVVKIAERAPAPAQPAPAATAAQPATVAARPALLAQAAALLVPAPVTPLTPVLPLPTPVTPAAPASTVSVGSPGSGRSRTASAQASQLADPPPTHVLLIGTDGTNMSKILEYTYDDPASGFRALMDQGVTGAGSIVDHTTISGPSWSTILTGAWDDKTGVINNIFNPAPYESWPTVFNLIEYYQPGVQTSVIADWQYINDIAEAGGYPADVNDFVGFDTSWEDTDDLVAQRTIDLINSAPASGSAFIFSYQVAVDEAGHVAGGDSPEYEAAVINTSENIKAILTAVDAWEAANPGQEWTVITTTDHGHQPQEGFGHGFQSPRETSTFVIFDLEGDGANDGTQNLGYSNADITPTIVNLFGVPQRSDFDGVPLQSKSDGIVDPADLRQSLSDAIANFGYPDVVTDIALSVRTVFASVPYFLDGFVTSITGFLQGIVDADIFLISALAGVAETAVQITGDMLVSATQAIARVVATLTGSGVIPPADEPLPPPPSSVLLPTSVLV